MIFGRFAALGPACALLVSCGGGGAGSVTSLPTPTPAPTVSPTAVAAAASIAGTLSLTFAPASAASERRHPAFLSPSATSVSIAVTGMPPVVADISANSPQCMTVPPSPTPSAPATGSSPGTRTCTVTVSAPVGADSFTAMLYDAPNATGNLLGTGTTSQTIVAATPFDVQIRVLGVPYSLTVRVSPSSYTVGTASSGTVTVAAYDYDENVISGTYASPIALTDSDATNTFALSTTTVTSSTTPVSLTYRGAGAMTATISATESGVQSSNVGPQTVTANLPAENIYAAEQGSNTVSVTLASGNGNVTPTRTIGGSSTTLGNPVGVAVDTTGVTYVSSVSGGSGGSNGLISVFAAGADGNVAPIRTIQGANTGLNQPLSLAIDTAGELFASNNADGDGGNITVYAAGASGNAAPIRTVSATGLDAPSGIAFDTAGLLYAANNRRNGGQPDALYVFAASVPGSNAPTLLRTISGNNTTLSNAIDVAVDSTGNAYVSSGSSNSIAVFGPTQTGNVAPTRTISGSNTQLDGPLGVTIDAAGNLYVSNQYSQSVTVYASGASGNVAPTRVITGGFATPYEIRIAR